MTSLKSKLNEVIKQRKYITLQEAYNFGATLKAKQKTVERTLNPSLSPDIHTHKNHKGQITGYSYKPSQTQEMPQHGTKDKQVVCCASQLLFSVCQKDCETLKSKQGMIF